MSDPEIIGPGDIYMEPRRGLGPLAKIFAVSAITIGVVALAGVVWFAYQQGIRSGAEDAAPVITAREEPIKREPTERGGLNVPHQDKLVFGRLAPGQIEEPVERLLPPPEEPAERPRAPVVEPVPAEVQATPAEVQTQAPAQAANETPAEEPNVVANVESNVETIVKAAEPEPAPAPTTAAVTPPSPPEVVVAAPPPPPPPAPEKTVAVAQPPAPVATPTPTVAPKPAVAPANAWRIQLAAVSSRERALSEWDRLKKRNDDLLGQLALNVQTVKLDRGTFFRIQAGPLTDRAAASGLCGKLKSRNQDCLIVAP